MSPHAPTTPEFSRLVDIERLADDPSVHEIAASPGECAALARRFGLQAVRRLGATVTLSRMSRGAGARGAGIALSARLAAEVVQTCIVTLEPVEARVEDEFTLLYCPPEAAGREAEAVTITLDDALIEPLAGRHIDIGEAVAQQLGLALDPYPRSPGAQVDAPRPAALAEGGTNRPFGGLKGFKARRPGPGEGR